MIIKFNLVIIVYDNTGSIFRSVRVNVPTYLFRKLGYFELAIRESGKASAKSTSISNVASFLV